LLQEAKFDPLDQDPLEDIPEQENLFKQEPPSSPSSSEMVIDYVPSPDSTSPTTVQGLRPKRVVHDVAFSDYDDSESETSTIHHLLPMKRPGPSKAMQAGPSKKARVEMDEDGSSIPSSANDLKIIYSRQRNNAASRRSRMNKKTRDEIHEGELKALEDRNTFLMTMAQKYERIRDELRAIAVAAMRGK